MYKALSRVMLPRAAGIVPVKLHEPKDLERNIIDKWNVLRNKREGERQNKG